MNVACNQAQVLIGLWQAFYFDTERYKLIEKLNKEPEKFDFNAVLALVPQ